MTKPLSSPISETGCREDLAEKGPVVLAFMGSDYEIAVRRHRCAKVGLRGSTEPMTPGAEKLNC